MKDESYYDALTTFGRVQPLCAGSPAWWVPSPAWIGSSDPSWPWACPRPPSFPSLPSSVWRTWTQCRLWLPLLAPLCYLWVRSAIWELELLVSCINLKLESQKTYLPPVFCPWPLFCVYSLVCCVSCLGSCYCCVVAAVAACMLFLDSALAFISYSLDTFFAIQNFYYSLRIIF